MRGSSWAVTIALTLLVAGTAPAFAQQARIANDEASSSRLAEADPDADREALRNFLNREDVRRVAQVSGVDLSGAESGVMALDGVQLSRAAQQARAIESQLGAQDQIRISATLLIIILLLVIIIIVAA